MQTQNRKLFRQQALDRLSSPEQLDQRVKVVLPHAWLHLAALTALVAIAGIWSIVGRIPLTVTGVGVLIRPRQVVPLQTSSTGQLLNLTVKSGDIVQQGQVIATLDQSSITQQLQQAQAQLDQLQSQNRDSQQLQRQQVAQELAALRQQQADLQTSLQRESVAPQIRQQTLAAFKQKRQSLQQQQQRSRTLLQTLQQRLESRRQLFAQKIISQDVVLQAEQEVLSTQTQLSDIDVQLKELDVQEVNSEQDYFQALNRLDQLRTEIKNLDAQKTKLVQQDLDQSIEKTNQRQDLQDKIAQLQLQLSNDSQITSPYSGRLLEVGVVPGQVINAGTRLGTIEAEEPNRLLESIVYFPNAAGKQIQPGMQVQVTPSIVKRERYGGIVGVVTQVSPFPVTTQDITAIVGNEDLAKNLASADGARVQVFVEMQSDATTASGYQWSSSRGPDIDLSSGTATSARVTVGEVAPISYLMPILRSWTGVY